MRGIGLHPMDPRDLIHEAYRIPGIGEQDCRAIFFDWAMGMDPTIEVSRAAATLLADLGPDPAHPMTALLRAAADKSAPTARAGGRAGRRPADG